MVLELVYRYQAKQVSFVFFNIEKFFNDNCYHMLQQFEHV